MNRTSIVVAALALTACNGASVTDTTVPATTTTTVTESTVVETTVEQLEECPDIPYDVGVLPARVDPGVRPDPDVVEPDEFTSIPATRSALWFDADGGVVVAFVRGALPPSEWPGDKGEVSIDGARGVAGPFDDGSWVVAWFEGNGDRCDRYFMVFYPPVEPAEVEATILSLDRTAG